ncbi:MAG TPA: hypothetical protein IAB12_04105 [Candidatus Ornithospirochaeta avicola]|uniref:Uncharacterized protein n=1 Tax=Candidatus Ornithospirochaeta avicola TaxID=2840896 RepID=A0A9D1PTR5_9SPIO|nr:hypothetical protein [Candidatus Ornithospirochaeta avicola]
MTLSKDENNLFSGSAKVSNGFYKISIKANDAEIIVFDSARVYSDLTTLCYTTYEGELADVEINDEIIRTPDLDLDITSGETIAANGTLSAEASVTNLSSPQFSWYINGVKVENANSSTFSKDITDYSKGEKLTLTVFVEENSIIWSESKSVTVIEGVTLPDNVTISTEADAVFGKEVTLTYSGSDIPEGTSAVWKVQEEILASSTFTPSVIGKNIPVTLTLNASGVTKDYSSSIDISPDMESFSVSPLEAPEKALLSVEYKLNAPESASVAVKANENELQISEGKIAVPENLNGSLSLYWIVKSGEDEWTADTPVSVSIEASAAAEKPENASDSVGGNTDDSKIEFVETVLSSLDESSITFYETSDGSFNLNRTAEKTETGYTYYGYVSGGYTFWGTKNGESIDLTVKDSNANAFTVKAEGDSYTLNGEVLVVIPSTPPEVNTDESFGGATGDDKLSYVNSVLSELIQSPGSSRLETIENDDGSITYKMSGHQTESYIFWGEGTINYYTGEVTDADVTIQDSENNVFKVTCVNRVFYLNGVACVPEPLDPPVMPTEEYQDMGHETTPEEWETATTIVKSDITYLPVQAIYSNADIQNETVGNLSITMSDFEIEATVINDYQEKVTAEIYNETSGEYEYFSADVTILKNSYMHQVQGFSDIKIYFTYEGKTYEYTPSESDSDGTLISDETIIDDEHLLAIADAVCTFISSDANVAMFKTNAVKALFGQDITLSENVVINIKNYEMDVIDPVMNTMIQNHEYLVSLKDFKVYTYDENISYSSEGLHVTMDVDTTGMSEENPDPSKMYSYLSLHGPVTVDGKEYYFDYTIDGITGQVERGIRVDGVWKALSMGY